MVGVLFWLIGSCFLLLGLFCLFVAVLVWLSRREGVERATFPKFLLWACAGIGSEGLMLVFYTFRP
ncbi:hypothetical protein [Streptomyces mexicanus]|jgi:hypothetical protein|uniref:hypothetical protein n=1 Tax=Streptomyces mexicanus TaxID=178566 RepID=UPI0036D1359E